MSDRLATIERVLSVEKHPNADKLDIIKVLGYECIVGREHYREGDLVVFVQPDSILPSDRTWATDLLRYTSRGRIRAVRLRGKIGTRAANEVIKAMDDLRSRGY